MNTQILSQIERDLGDAIEEALSNQFGDWYVVIGSHATKDYQELAVDFDPERMLLSVLRTEPNGDSVLVGQAKIEIKLDLIGKEQGHGSE